jgi:hypothetical protein
MFNYDGTFGGDTIDARVEAGARHLDKVDPSWFERINLGVLDIGDGRCCVLAQLAGGDWTRGIKEYGLEGPASQYGHGFYQGCPQQDPNVQEGYRQLTESWKEAITARRISTFASLEIAA